MDFCACTRAANVAQKLTRGQVTCQLAYGFSRRGIAHHPVRQRTHPPRMSPNTKTDGPAGDFAFGGTIVPSRQGIGDAEEEVLYPHTG